jgi:protocatechuate 3,4-dioxygenase beta subunit
MNDDVSLEGRRGVLQALGAAAGLILLDCGGEPLAAVDAGDDAVSTSRSDGGRCVLDPNLTKGPFWIDGQLERSDIRSDSTGKASPNPRPGLPMALRIVVFAYGAGACTPLEGAQVDVWHTDGTGLYSDVQSLAGENFLRGWQRTDSKGRVMFTTIYPGWYPGRAVHIHVKVRLFDASKNTTTEATTQLFFDDSVTDKVFASHAPYDGRGTRTTLNSQDAYYGGNTELLVAFSGSATAAYAATISLGVQVGTVNAG